MKSLVGHFLEELAKRPRIPGKHLQHRISQAAPDIITAESDS
jgi:hypothetical protein